MSDANPLPDNSECDDELKNALAAAFGDDAMSMLDDDDSDDELKNALSAAFGDDAMSMLDDDDGDEISEEMLIALGGETQANSSDIFGNDEDASPLIRFVKDLNRAIYSNGAALQNGGNEPQSAARTPRLVVFSVGEQQFGLPFNDVLEIARYPKVTALPRTPAWLRGVANLRGQILSVTDLRNLLQFTSERPAVGEKIIVVRSKRHSASTAIVVDSVLGIRDFGDDQGDVSDFSHRVARISNGTATIDQETTVLIDPDKLFGSAELLAFAH